MERCAQASVAQRVLLASCDLRFFIRHLWRTKSKLPRGATGREPFGGSAFPAGDLSGRKGEGTAGVADQWILTFRFSAEFMAKLWLNWIFDPSGVLNCWALTVKVA